MQKVILINGILVLLISFTCCSQTNDSFNEFRNKFNDCELPLDGEDLADGQIISSEEFDLFSLGSEFWLYEGDYYYNSSVKFKLDNEIYALIYIRSYYPDNIENEKKEAVLATFDNNGEIVSSLPIHGIHGDNLTFYGNIDAQYFVTINFQKFEIDNKTGESIVIKNETKYKIIKETGKIEILK